MDKKWLFRLFLNVFIVLLTIIAVVLTYMNQVLMRVCFVHGAYYLIFVLFVLWIVTLLEFANVKQLNLLSFLRRHALDLFFCFALSVLVFISTGPMFRLFADEVNLLSVSRSMLYEKRVDSVVEGLKYLKEFHPLTRVLPTRCLLFPFFEHILHVMTGYRTENAFALNFMVLFTFLSSLMIFLKRRFGSIFASSVLFLIVAQPAFTQTATSGLSDLLLVLFVLFSFLSLKQFLEVQSEIHFRLLWVNLVMLANVRYESCIFLIVTILLLFLLRYAKVSYFGESFVYSLSFFLVLPLFWQRILTAQSFGSFSFECFLRNSFISFSNMLNLSFRFHNAGALSLFGFLCLLYFLLFLSRKFFQNRERVYLALISFANIFAWWFIVASYTVVDFNRYSACRFFLIFCVVFSFFALFVLSHFKVFSKKPVLLLIVSIAVFLIYHPASIANSFHCKLYYTRDYYIIMDFLKEQKGNDFLLITNRPKQYVIHNYGVISFETANNRKAEVLDGLAKHSFSKIFVVQQLEYGSFLPIDGTKLDSDYSLKSLFELRNRRGSFLRISKVTPHSATGIKCTQYTQAPQAISEIKLKLVKVITSPEIDHPKSVKFSPDGKTVYVNNLYTHNTAIIDAEDFGIRKIIKYDGRTCDMDITKDGRYLWVTLAALEGDNYPPYVGEPLPGWEDYNFPSVVLVEDSSKDGGEVIKRINVEVKPKIVALTPDEKYAFVSNFNSGTVSVISTRDYSVVKSIKVGRFPRGICFVDNGKYAYVANMGSHNLSMIDVDSLEVVKTIEDVGTPRHLVTSKDGKHVYISNAEKRGAIKKLDTSSNKIIAVAATGNTTRTIALSPDERYIFGVNYHSDDISVVDTAAMKELIRVPTRQLPVGLAVSPDGKRLWVCSFRESCVLVYDIVGRKG